MAVAQSRGVILCPLGRTRRLGLRCDGSPRTPPEAHGLMARCFADLEFQGSWPLWTCRRLQLAFEMGLPYGGYLVEGVETWRRGSWPSETFVCLSRSHHWRLRMCTSGMVLSRLSRSSQGRCLMFGVACCVTNKQRPHMTKLPL